jgi:hypothetical protein
MDSYRPPGDTAMRPDPVDSGWARVIRHGPRSVGEVLRSASAAMDEQDEAEGRATDPVASIRAERSRHTLWGRMFGRR